MRRVRLGALLAVGLMLVVTGCGRVVNGTAGADPYTPGTAITADGYGITAGDPAAPIHIELYIEPHCVPCTQLEGQSGPQLQNLIERGELAVTYRPLTFADQSSGGFPARIMNALFIAAGYGTSGSAFQAFVANIWGHEDPSGPGPTDAELAAMADSSHVGPGAVTRIESGRTVLNADDMAAENAHRLQQVMPNLASTPAVYDLYLDKLVDTNRNDWLTKLMSSKVTT